MTDPITPATIVRLRELLDAATSGGRGWRAVMRGDEWRIRAPHPAASSCEPSLDCENNVKAIVEVFNAIHQLLDQLDAQAAEIERVREELSESEKRETAIVVIGAILGSDWFCEQADGAERPSWSDALDIVRKLKGERNAAQARVAELKGLLREIRDSYHDNRAGGWPGAGDVFADAICRIDAALSKREGGR